MDSKEAMMLPTLTKRKWVQMQVDSYVWQQKDMGDPCLTSSSHLQIKIRLSTESEGRRLEGLRVNVDAIFERHGRRYFPENYNKLARWGGLTLG